jgi:DNA-binding response OmpR family regulator
LSVSAEGKGQRFLVLVAEDEAIIALELEDSLKAAGFEIAGPFATCAAAEGWLETGRPDVAILDNALKDGPCDKLAADLKACGVPVVIYSGHAKGDDPFSEHWTGPWLVKPVAFPMLVASLRDEMGRMPGAT